MPRYCCVPNCTSNKPGQPYVSVFRFPKDEQLLQTWKKKIPRDFKNTNNSVVCIKHFPESFIVRKDKITDKTGTVIEIPRVYPKLSENAYPCIFPGCPSYLNEKIKERSVTIQRKEKMKQLDEQLLTNFIKKDEITSFEYLKENLLMQENPISDFLSKNNVLKHDCESCITFLFINCENCPSILKSLKINTDLSIVIFNNNRQLNIPSIGKILNNPPKLTYFSELLNILNTVNVFEEICSINSVPDHVMAIQSWEKYIENCNAENFEAANFILEQMKLLNSNKHGRKYSSNLMVFSFCMYIKSTACYSYVRDKGNIILPSLRQLQRVASGLNVTPGLSTLANENYLRGRCKELKDHEKHVILQIDEIFIKSAITYKCNKIVGLTEKGDAATTIQCFLYSSLLSKNKEIVSLNPVKNMNAEDLHSMTLEVLALMEKVGFSVVCIISDNNRVNRNCFSKLCNGTIKSVIQNPANNTKKLHLIFDSVHLIKSIRNNWLNQKDADSSLMYPDPSEFSQIRKASFSSLFKIYNEEMNNIVKLAPKLCLKALKPTNFEKQNVKLVLKVFEESNVTALNILQDKLGYPEMFRDTAIFIKHILDFWQIMNIKNPTKGQNLKLKNSVPFSSIDDDRFTFFSKFVQWLDCWKNLKQNKREGCFSEETFFALRHTVNTIPELIKYLLMEQNFKYVLTGKFQTDNLEARFGQYRQMSGSNYHITVQEILQAEKKLRIKSVLTFHSDKYGTISLKNLISNHSGEVFNVKVDIKDFNEILNTTNKSDDISIEEYQVLMYIAGYCVHNIKFECSDCKYTFVLDKQINFDSEIVEETKYLRLLDRGGLKMPTDIVMKVISTQYFIFNLLISKTFESKFLKVDCQLSCFTSITEAYLELHELWNVLHSFHSPCVNCNIPAFSYFKKIFITFGNICLNNYSKKRSEEILTVKDNRKIKKFKAN